MSRFIGQTQGDVGSAKAAIVLGVCVNIIGLPAAANDFTAEKVMKEMNAAERYSYVAGVVEGLAVARYMNDGKKKDGMQCIYDWFYDDKSTIETIYAAFDRYASYPPGSVVDALSKQRCGE